MNDLKSIKAKAWSLPPGETRGELVGIEQTKYGTFKYYYDKSDESYWYQSESTERFHKEMKENEKMVVDQKPDLSALSQENAACMEEAAASVATQEQAIEKVSVSSEDVAGLARNLQEVISKFKLD